MIWPVVDKHLQIHHKEFSFMKTLKVSLLFAALFVAGNAFATAGAAAPAADAKAGEAKASAATPAAPTLNELAKTAAEARKVATDAGDKVTAEQALAAFTAENKFAEANKAAGVWNKYSSKISRNKVNTAIIAAAVVAAGAAVYYKVACHCEDAEAAPAA
jgi:hypothetical protein